MIRTKISGPQVITELRAKLRFGIGRHLYGVLGTYAQLAQFEQDDLAQARTSQGESFPRPINVNRELLANIGDEELRQLVKAEARRPQAVRRRLEQELDSMLGDLLERDHFLILKQLELAFAHSLDLGVFRIRATNQNHLLLLLPGERRGQHITLFHEVDPRYHRSLPTNLIADNHLWELKDE
jgi:hypothetical protein